MGKGRWWALSCLVLALRPLFVLSQQSNATWQGELLERGYYVFRGVLSANQLRQASRILLDRWDRSRPGRFGKDRQYALLEQDPVFAEFLEAIPEQLAGFMTWLMGPWIVGAFDVHAFHPPTAYPPVDPEARVREKAWSLHSDFPYGHHAQQTKFKAVPKSYPHTVQLIFMVSDFTVDNGATIMLPGSHKTRKLPQDLGERLAILNKTVPVTGKAGDLIVYIGQTWHGNDIHVAKHPGIRIGVIAQCLPWYFKPMQSFMYTLPYRVEKRLSPRLRVRLGLKFSHFFGHTATMGYHTLRQRLNYHCGFLWDMLYEGYRTPGNRNLFRRFALGALFVPAVVFLVARLEAIRLLIAILLGMFLGCAMTMERFGL